MSVPPCRVGLDTDFSPFRLISCPQPGTLLDIQSLYCFSATKGWVLEDCRFYTQGRAASWVVTAGPLVGPATSLGPCMKGG